MRASSSVEFSQFGSFARLLADKGTQHEAECLEHYRADGRSIYEVPARAPGERFDDWVARVGTPWDDGYDVIYQMPFVHDGMRGIADFLVRVDGPSADACAYEPVDAKLARTEAKPGHVLQLCFYADALRAATGAAPERLHLWLGSGRIESLVTREFHPYWRRLRSQLQRAGRRRTRPLQETRPEPCAHCEFCEFAGVCNAQWRDEDSLVFVAGIRSERPIDLEDSAISTLAGPGGVRRRGGLDAPRAARAVGHPGRAPGRGADRPRRPAPVPAHRGPARTRPGAGDWSCCPQPDDGDVFLDFEGDPFWTADRGLFFLFGLIARDADGDWIYEPRWAHDRAGEEQATGDLIEYLQESPGRAPGHARLPLQPHGAIGPGAPGRRSRCR